MTPPTSTTADPVTAYVALGANLGDRLAAFRGALDALEAVEGVRVSALSALYETAPVGGPGGQETFFNAVARMETTLPALDLLDLLQKTELDFHRTREVHWGPRTLDLDLLFYGDAALKTERLNLPHHGLHERRFVLAPLADVGADQRHPVLGRTVAELLAALPEDDTDDVVRTLEEWR